MGWCRITTITILPQLAFTRLFGKSVGEGSAALECRRATNRFREAPYHRQFSGHMRPSPVEGDSDCLSPLRSTSAALFVHSNLDFHPESMRECIVGVKYDQSNGGGSFYASKALI